MTDMNVSANRPHSVASRFLQQTPAAPTGGAAPFAVSLPIDQLRLTGGAGPEFDPAVAQQAADTIALMQSTDVRERFQAIVNMTKMDPATAIPLLQKAAQDSDPRVVELANRALAVMQQMQGAQQAAPTPGTPGATPAAPAATPTAPAAPPPAAPPAQVVTPTAPAPLPQIAAPAIAAAPAPVITAAATAVNLGPNKNTAMVRALENRINRGEESAVPELAAYKDTDKAEVLRVLLTKIMSSNDGAVDDCIRLLQDMRAKEALPYLETIARSKSQTGDNITAAIGAIDATIKELHAKGGLGAQEAGVQIRAQEVRAGFGGDVGAQAIAEIAAVADKNRPEALRALLTVITQSADGRVVPAACQVLMQMKAQEAMPYLQAVMADPRQGGLCIQAAAQAIQYIQAAAGQPAAPAATPAAAPAAAPAATPAAPVQTQQTPGNIPSFLRPRQ